MQYLLPQEPKTLKIVSIWVVEVDAVVSARVHSSREVGRAQTRRQQLHLLERNVHVAAWTEPQQLCRRTLVIWRVSLEA